MNEREIEAGLAQTPGYRYADRVGDQLYVAGQVPHDHEGVLVGRDDPVAQATRCLDNLRLVIEQHDFRIADIRTLTIYVVGPIEDLSSAWGAVTTWFGGEVPPATLLGVPVLGHQDQVVEIDATIVRA
jgi:2-iminobutanoate/2-iminopropanoate deaminase